MKSSRKSGNGQGSVYRVGKKWRWQITTGVGPDGKPVRMSGLCATKSEAEAQKSAKLTDLRRGKFADPSKSTVGEWIDNWLELKQSAVRSSTFSTMQIYLRTYVSPEFRKLRLQALKPSDLRKLDASLCQRNNKPLSQATRSKTISYLRSAFDMAIEEGLLTNNPASRVRVHATADELEQQKTKALTRRELAQFLAAAEQHPLYVLFFTLFALGIRRGEALGLEWRDIDLKKATITIERQLSMDGNKVTRRATKTAGSRRTLYLEQELVALLKQHREAEQAKAELVGLPWNQGCCVFTSTVGTPLHPRNVNHTIQRICRSAGLRRFSSHAGRHTNITMRLQNGQPVEVVAAIAGHTDINTTLAHYRSVSTEEKRKATFSLSDCLVTES